MYDCGSCLHLDKSRKAETENKLAYRYGCNNTKATKGYGRENLNKELEINHINGIKSDNRIENLELVTPSENQNHAYRIGLKKPLKMENNPSAILCLKQVRRIKELITLGLSDAEISKIFDVTATTIQHIRKGKTWI